MALTDITFTRIDTPPLEDEKFAYQMANWLSNLVDVLNYDLTLIENAFIRDNVTLVGGTATIMTNQIKSVDSVFTSLINAVNPGFITVTIVDGVSFTLTSSNGADASTYSYMITKI